LAQRQAGDILTAPGATFVRGFPWAFRFDDRGNCGWGRGIVYDSNGSVQLAEVNREDGPLRIEFCARPDGEQWALDLDDLRAAIDAAVR
jgi:hypothetical protein